MSKNEVEETVQQKTETVSETVVATVATEHQDSSSEAGSEESMGKDGKMASDPQNAGGRGCDR